MGAARLLNGGGRGGDQRLDRLRSDGLGRPDRCGHRRRRDRNPHHVGLARRRVRRRRDLFPFPERGPDLRRVQVPEDHGRQDRHREANARAGELEERKDCLEQRDARHDEHEDARPRLKRPEADCGEDPNDPGNDREPTPQAHGFEPGEVAKDAEPVESNHAEADEQPAEAGEGCEETEDRNEDGRVLHPVCLPLSGASNTTPAVTIGLRCCRSAN